MNEVINAIISRRSCKKYKPDMVPDQLIDQIIEAGLYAASAMGWQSPIIVAVKDKGTRDMLSGLNAKYDPFKRKDPFYGAPVVLAVLVEKKFRTALYDGSLVLGNMMLAAHSLGIGSCWIHRAKEAFNDPEGKSLLQKLGIQGDYEGIGHCVIGYPDVLPSSPLPRRPNRVYRI